MNTSYKNIFILSLFIISLTSCSTKKESAVTDEHMDEPTTVEITKEQYQTVGIELGKITSQKLSGTIKATGVLDAPPQNLISVSALFGGFLKSTDLLQGKAVRKGELIAVMQHPDYIQMQQDYLDGKSQLEFLEMEYQRQQELAKENVNSQKTLQQSKSQFMSMESRIKGLEKKLALINIDPATLQNSNIRSEINIYSPITGFVTEMNVNIGAYVNPNDVMFKIVDTDHLHAELTIFERDVQRIKPGQKVRFTLADESVERKATVYLIGREISADRTVRIHGHLDSEDKNLLPGMYLKAVVEAGGHDVPALPNSAVVDFEGKKYVFVSSNAQRDSLHFEMMEVKLGVSESGFTEVIVPESINVQDSQFVVKGAYDLLSKMKNAEEEE